MYGGKIDNDQDFALLTGMVKNVFDPAAYDNGHMLVSGTDGGADELQVPAGTTIKDFQKWVDRLPEREPPTYLGLPADAEKVLLVKQGQETIRNLSKIVDMLEEGEQLSEGSVSEA
jgi:dynein heavy chain 1